MGKNSKAQEAALAKAYQEEKRRKEQEKLKRQNRIFWIIVASSLAVIAAACVLTAVLTRDKTPKVPTMDDIDFSSVDPANCRETDKETDYVKLTVTYRDKDDAEQTGDIIVRLYPDVAPLTVKNFKKLVAEGFYNGTPFHRIYAGFMIQGGDDDGDGVGGSSETIVGEFTSNGFQNNLKHVRGVLSMARTTAPNSASSQFFIMHATTASLDGNYASFGYVVSGMDVVDGIAGTPTVYNASDKANTTPVTMPILDRAVFVTVD